MESPRRQAARFDGSDGPPDSPSRKIDEEAILRHAIERSIHGRPSEDPIIEYGPLLWRQILLGPDIDQMEENVALVKSSTFHHAIDNKPGARIPH
jgi:hypothetical protein